MSGSDRWIDRPLLRHGRSPDARYRAQAAKLVLVARLVSAGLAAMPGS